jgi:hypothetical protein
VSPRHYQPPYTADLSSAAPTAITKQNTTIFTSTAMHINTSIFASLLHHGTTSMHALHSCSWDEVTHGDTVTHRQVM